MNGIGWPADLTWYKLLTDWGGVVGGLLALIAAGVAALPVWRQLSTLKVQSAAMARDTLVTRATAIEARRHTTRQKMRSITNEFMARLHQDDDGADQPDINYEWADQAEQITDGVVALLVIQQETSLDGELIDAKRSVAIRQAEALSDCLSKIHRPYSADLTKEETKVARETGIQAEKKLDGCISAVSKSADDLDAAFRAGLEQLRSRISRIDALIIRDTRKGRNVKDRF